MLCAGLTKVFVVHVDLSIARICRYRIAVCLNTIERDLPTLMDRVNFLLRCTNAKSYGVDHGSRERWETSDYAPAQFE